MKEQVDYKTGLILGKFFPLHQGHMKLIEYGVARCNKLIVLVCASNAEEISGEIRLSWVSETYQSVPTIFPQLLKYDESELPNTSISSREVSKVWGSKLRKILPSIDIIFSSEPYGEYLATFLEAQHLSYDFNREIIAISASQIRANPSVFLEFIAPVAQRYFLTK